ncbi:ABC transporter permease [Pleomorphomonas sp. NRK KF1]|uniref:cell division protein FtsX n=1 Tax=Pleomorphomonas sp. NRK KF1 TaxID=2943000 RepID=UPI002044B197|nr:ABC transporter permease [Pleomorphomonas sp. NRK KF1]MCM5554426.1 ABC transporter permease [Pleomorphomonas sp. NRK KF1]
MKTPIPRPKRRATASKARPGGDTTLASPIVPPQAIAGRTLVLVIAIMTFLAGFTIAVVSVIDRAADAWASDIGREVTIEIRPLDGVAIDAEVEKAVALAQEFPGVGGARAITEAETQRLLEPWLGPDTDLSALPVPRLVIVSIDDAASFGVKALSDAVGRDIRGGSVDDHALWVDRLSAMASSMVFAGVGLMSLMLVALILSVVFATRAAMAGNRDVIEVLHFCGAEDRFIAGQFQRRFLLFGIEGGAIGGALALLAMGIAAWAIGGSAGRPGADQIEAMFGRFELPGTAYALVLSLVVAVALLTALTSRLAVRRSLSALD